MHKQKLMKTFETDGTFVAKKQRAVLALVQTAVSRCLTTTKTNTDEFRQTPNQLLSESCTIEQGFLPMVQLAVIFLRLGLCRSSSSSRFVGSHIEYFSPIPDVLENTRIIFYIKQPMNTHNTFILQKCIELIQSDSLKCYNVTKYFHFN